MSRNRGAVAALIAGTLVAWTGAGCVSRTVTPARTSTGPEPGVVVEQFLRAVNANDLEAMGRLFGTRNGSVTRIDPRANVEQRMFALASVLRHESFAVEQNRAVPGRSQEAVQIVVRMHIGERHLPVPFTLVQSRDGWVVEQIGIEVITGRP
jgi:hypothetical protein